jgi:hypothetical protein
VSERRRWQGVKRASGEEGKGEGRGGRVRRGRQSECKVSEVGEPDKDRWDQVLMGSVVSGEAGRG